MVIIINPNHQTPPPFTRKLSLYLYLNNDNFGIQMKQYACFYFLIYLIVSNCSLICWAAYQRLCRLEGIIPAMEASHALGFLEKLCPTLPDGAKVVVNCSGRGDKDAPAVFSLTQGSTLPDLLSHTKGIL